MVRVRMPDGLVLQATFAAGAPVSRVLGWVEGSLREPGHAFSLALPGSGAAPLGDGDMSRTLEQAELAPACMLHFRLPANEAAAFAPPYLTATLMNALQLLGEESIPQSVGGGADGGRAEANDGGGSRSARGGGEKRAPAWMRPQ